MDYSAGGKCVHIVTQKNRSEDIIPISEEALDLIGYSPNKQGMVFKGLQRCWTQTYMEEWIRSAGITKKITFHLARHTFGTMMLTLGADIYTTSKLMGHTKVEVTQIYAKIINKKKDDAVSLIDQAFA